MHLSLTYRLKKKRKRVLLTTKCLVVCSLHAKKLVMLKQTFTPRKSCSLREQLVVKWQMFSVVLRARKMVKNWFCELRGMWAHKTRLSMTFRVSGWLGIDMRRTAAAAFCRFNLSLPVSVLHAWAYACVEIDFFPFLFISAVVLPRQLTLSCSAPLHFDSHERVVVGKRAWSLFFSSLASLCLSARAKRTTIKSKGFNLRKSAGIALTRNLQFVKTRQTSAGLNTPFVLGSCSWLVILSR